jgi:hypothetical protein
LIKVTGVLSHKLSYQNLAAWSGPTSNCFDEEDLEKSLQLGGICLHFDASITLT